MNESQVIRVRYWAAARAAAGVAEEDYAVDGPLALDEVLALVARRHADGRLPDVVRACSVLVGERPVSSQDPAQVRVAPGDVVELLPPFAGG